jgi:hypothetical protein
VTTCSSRLGLSLCGIVATIALGANCQPARADDGLPPAPTATTIAATVSAALDTTAATVQLPPAITPAATDAAVTGVVPAVSPPIPPAIPAAEASVPPAPAPTTSAPPPEPDPATTPDPAPPTPPSVPTPPAPAAPTAPVPDTGNTTPDNSNSITATPVSDTQISPSQTFVWNWTWNCDPDSTPAVPVLPPGTTTIVWNWHWACSDVTPQPLVAAGMTICTSCNIAVSLRIASPGDSGSIAQTIATQAAATVAQVSAEVQEHAQAAETPVPPAAAAVAPPALAAASSDPAAPVLQMQIDLAPTGPIESSLVDDEAPRHGGQALLATSRGDVTSQSLTGKLTGEVIGVSTTRWRNSRRDPLVVSSLRAASRADSQRHAGTAAASSATATSTPRPPSPPRPSHEFPLPAVVALSPVGLQHPASSALVPLAIGGLAVVIQVFFIYLAPLGRLVRARAGVAEPHPPG